MLHDLLRIGMPVAVLAVLTLIGYAATTWLDRDCWGFLVPALPAVGVIVSVVVLHWTTIFVGTDQGVWVLVALAVGSIAWAAVRAPHRLRLSRASCGSLVLALALGVPTLILAGQPAFRLDDANVVHPSGNHDSFFYVSDSAWLMEHRGTSRPELGPTPSTSTDVPADQPAIATYIYGFRLGEPLLQASVSSLSGRALATFWYEVTTGWLVMLPGAAMALAASLRMKRWIGGVAGCAASRASSLALFQVYNQNDPSVLALAVLPLVLALVVRAGVGAEDEAGARPVEGIVVAGIAIAAFVGTYSELATLVGLAMLACMLAAGRPWRRTLSRTALVGLCAVAASPLAVYNSMRLLTTLSTLTGDYPRKAFTQRAVVAVAHATGTTGINEPSSRTGLALLLAAILVTGLALALVVQRLRILALWMSVSAAAVFTLQYRQRNDYSLERFVMVAEPLLALLAFMGLLAGAAVVARSRLPVVLRSGAATIAVAGIVVVSWTQVTTQLRITPGVAALRTVSVRPAVVEAIGWAKRAGGPDGADVTVVTDDYVDRLWLTDGLRRLRDVSYPYLTGDYFGVTSFDDGHLTRFLIASRQVFTDAPATAIVARNDRYVMYDLRDVTAWFALPVDGFYGMEGQSDGSAANWANQEAQMVTMRTSPAAQISFRAVVNPNVGPLHVDVEVGGARTSFVTIGAAPAEVDLPLPPGPLVTTVMLHADQPGAHLSTDDLRVGAYNVDAPLTGAGL